MKRIIYITILAVILTISVNAQENIAGNTLYYTGQNAVDFGQVDFNFSNQLTIMFWVKWTIDPSNGNKWANMVTINSESRSDSGQFWIQHNSNNTKFEFALATMGNNNHMSQSSVFSSTSPQVDVWYNVAVTYDGSRMKIYINGILENTKNKSGNVYPFQNDYVLTVASWAVNNFTRTFEGQIDELSIWNVAKTDEEIIDIMNNLLVGDENNLIAYYRFDDSEANIITDLSGNAVHGTNVGVNGGNPAELINSTAPIFGFLPIELLSFDASSEANEVELNWVTATEINNDYFTIYRSDDGFSWEEIGTVEGSGNINIKAEYSYTDYSPNAVNLYYKLRQTDFDGKYEEFDVVMANVDFSSEQISIYPNPAVDNLNLVLPSNLSVDNLNLVVYNNIGQIVISQKVESFSNTINIDLSSQINGVYYIHLRNDNNTFYKESFIVSK